MNRLASVAETESRVRVGSQVLPVRGAGRAAGTTVTVLARPETVVLTPA